MEVREHPGHGRCAFASRAYSVGDLVHEERPLLIWAGNSHTLASALTAVHHFLEAYKAAEPDVRRRIREHFRSPPPRPGSVAMELADSLSHVHTDMLQEELLHLVGIVRSNAHSFGAGKASALFELAAMVSHSCAPNMRVMSTDEVLRYYAIAPIAAGDMLTFSYLDVAFLWHPTRTRVQRLLEPYGFVCRCARCDGIDTTRAFSCSKCLKGLVYPDERRYLAALEAGERSSDVPLVFSCVGCAASPSEDELPLDAEVAYYRDVVRLMQRTVGPDDFDWTTKLPQVRTVLGEKHWIFATLCKWRGERGLPLIITGEESPTAAFMCFLKAIRFAQHIGQPSLMQYDFPLYVRVCRPRLAAITELLQRTSSSDFSWREWLESVHAFWLPQIIEAAETDDAFMQLMRALGSEK